MTTKRELLFVADGEDSEGNKKSIWVYRQGASIYLSVDAPGKQHLCHSSVTSREHILSEIYSVYGVEVKSVKEPFEIAEELNKK